LFGTCFLFVLAMTYMLLKIKIAGLVPLQDDAEKAALVWSRYLVHPI